MSMLSRLDLIVRSVCRLLRYRRNKGDRLNRITLMAGFNAILPSKIRKS